MTVDALKSADNLRIRLVENGFLVVNETGPYYEPSLRGSWVFSSAKDLAQWFERWGNVHQLGAESSEVECPDQTAGRSVSPDMSDESSDQYVDRLWVVSAFCDPTRAYFFRSGMAPMEAAQSLLALKDACGHGHVRMLNNDGPSIEVFESFREFLRRFAQRFSYLLSPSQAICLAL